jgi:hypothetical protein
MEKECYSECCADNCFRITKDVYCKACEEDLLRRETRSLVYENTEDLEYVNVREKF